MPRIEIARGLLLHSYEPHALPGAFIVQHYRVQDATDATPPGRIDWAGPGHWLESRDGVPAGYRAVWLGSPEVAHPLIVWVEEQPTPESDDYDRGYRRAFAAKRRPVIREGMPPGEVEGVLDGWRDRKAKLSSD